MCGFKYRSFYMPAHKLNHLVAVAIKGILEKKFQMVLKLFIFIHQNILKHI